MAESSKAVFLSYASQDAEAACRICEALRTAGVEVWFDQSELVGGDAWDQKIRRQIKECALFVPIISANTNARREGYFRREWKVAVDRTHDMDEGLPFLLPVVIDATTDAGAFVPEKFREVQWSRLPEGETSAKFCERVRRLLHGGDGSPPASSGAPRAGATPAAPRARRRVPAAAWVGATLVAVVAVAYVLWRQRGPATTADSAGSAGRPAVTATLTEAQKLTGQARALLDDDPMQLRESFFLADELAQRAVKADPTDGEAWAIAGRVSVLMARRRFDASAAREEQARMQVDRAMNLAPASIESRFAQALFQVIAGDRESAARMLRELAERMPTDWRFLLELGHLQHGARNDEEALDYFRRAAALAHGDPRPEAEVAASLVRLLRLAEAEEVYARVLAGTPGRAAYFHRFVMLAIYVYDVPAAKALLEKIPPRMRQEDTLISTAAEFFLRTGEGDRVLAELNRMPRDFFEDGFDWRPKGYFAGYAHQISGRSAAAQAEWKQALAVVNKRLAAEPNKRSLLYWQSLLQALTGQAAEARAGRKLQRELVGTTSTRTGTWFDAILLVALGEREEAISSLVQAWPKADINLRNDLWGDFLYAPWFAAIRDDPRIRAMAMEHKTAIDRALKRDAAAAPAKADEKSIAVLAFKNLSDDKENEYFSDGISEELINVLGRVPGLTVKGRSSSFYFKGGNATAQEKGQKLGATYLVDGSVRKSGNKVRITAQLTRAATDEVIWSSEPLERDLKDVFAVQEEIAALIARNLSLKVGAPAAAAATAINPEVLTLYLQGRQAWNLRTMQGFARAEVLLNRALELDPNFASAYAALADTWVLRANQAGLINRYDQAGAPEFGRIRATIQRALALDPDLAEAHAALGGAESNAWRLVEAERHLRRAVALNPNYATAHQLLGRLQERLGFMDEALVELKLASGLDPLSARLASNHAAALYIAGRTSEALAACDRASAIRADERQAIWWKSAALLRLGRGDEALRVIDELGTEDENALHFRLRVLAQLGRTTEAEALWRRTNPDVLREQRIHSLLVLGQRAEALALLEPGALTSTGVANLLFSADFDPLRNEPKLAATLAAVGLAEAYARAQAWRAAQPTEQAR